MSMPVTLSPNSALGYCTPLSREPITSAQAEPLSRMLKALADPVRLRLMSMVLSHDKVTSRCVVENLDIVRDQLC